MNNKSEAIKLLKFQLLLEQNFKCEICSSPITMDNSCLDHCHSTSYIRGVICHSCNQGLGRFNDDLELFNLAIDYIVKYKNNSRHLTHKALINNLKVIKQVEKESYVHIKTELLKLGISQDIVNFMLCKTFSTGVDNL